MSVKKPRQNGKPALRRSAPHSKNSRASNQATVEQLLAAVYDHFQKLDNRAANRECRRDFVFHMTDWIEDLRNLSKLYANPQGSQRYEADDIVSGFLYHATAHIMEAARLMLDWEPGYIFDSPKPKKTERNVKPARP